MPDGLPVASRDAPVGGQAVLEGVMMRGVSTWAVAVRKPDEQIEVISEPLVSWAKRHRVLRWPVIRGVVALAESLRIGFRALGISANAQIEPEDGRGAGADRRLDVGDHDRAVAGSRGRPLLRHPRRGDQPDQGRARLLAPVLARRGDSAHRDLHRLHRGDQPPARPAARVRVPRRRAQDHLLLRGGRPADPGAGGALLPPPPPLRHELPAGRDGGRDLRLRAHRPSGLVLAARLPDPGHPADRGDLLRGDQVGGAQPPQALGAGA